MAKLDFTIDADITRAATPPAAFYRAPEIYDSVRERVFARSWQYVGDVEHVRVPGQTQPLTLLDGCLDEPLLLTRDHDDRLHCVSNVCTHRGALVCEHAGVERALRCRYHGRRFGLDGRFQSMPQFDAVRDFPSEADHLRPIQHGSWGSLIFASLNPRESLDAWLAPIKHRVGWLPLSEFKLDATRAREYLVRCNWALYCENYLEGFHIPFVHASLAEQLEFGAYRTELFETSSLQLGVAKGAEDAFDLPRESPDFGTRVAAYYFWLFPNLMLNFYPWGLSINVVRPLGVDRTRVSFISYVWRPEKLGQGAGAELDRVEREDESVVESVQRGVRSRIYERGRYSSTMETGTHHFHRLLVDWLAADC